MNFREPHSAKKNLWCRPETRIHQPISIYTREPGFFPSAPEPRTFERRLPPSPAPRWCRHPGYPPAKDRIHQARTVYTRPSIGKKDSGRSSGNTREKRLILKSPCTNSANHPSRKPWTPTIACVDGPRAVFRVNTALGKNLRYTKCPQPPESTPLAPPRKHCNS